MESILVTVLWIILGFVIVGAVLFAVKKSGILSAEGYQMLLWVIGLIVLILGIILLIHWLQGGGLSRL